MSETFTAASLGWKESRPSGFEAATAEPGSLLLQKEARGTWRERRRENAALLGMTNLHHDDVLHDTIPVIPGGLAAWIATICSRPSSWKSPHPLSVFLMGRLTAYADPGTREAFHDPENAHPISTHSETKNFIAPRCGSVLWRQSSAAPWMQTRLRRGALSTNTLENGSSKNFCKKANARVHSSFDTRQDFSKDLQTPWTAVD